MPPTPMVKRPALKELAQVLLVYAGFALAVTWLFRISGTGASAVIAVLPVLLLAWRQGPLWGTFHALTLFLISGVIFHFSLPPGVPMAPKGPEPFLGLGSWILMAIFCGTLSRTAQRLVKELELRQRLAQELRKHQDSLEATIADRSRELEAARDQLVEAEKMHAVGRLASGLAHDFNNQLTIVLGQTQLLLQRLEDPSLRIHAQRIQDAGSEASELARSLLSFARQGRVRTEPMDVHQLLQEAAAMVRPTLKAQIQLKQDLAARRHHTVGDPGQIKNALINLLINARDAIGRWGTIELQTRDEASADGEPGIRIEVRDDGCGIAPENRDRIFDPFFTTKPEGAGTGLGLAAVRSTMASHGGTLNLESRPGQGSTFSLHLSACEAPAAASEAEPPHPTMAEGTRILLVDDEEFVGEVVEELLTSIGARVTRFHDPTRALAWFHKHADDCALGILDLHMPGMDGLETIQAMHVVNPDFPALLLSGSVLDPGQAALAAQHVRSVIAKPCGLEALQAHIARALAPECKAGWPQEEPS
ncbi:MAG TPA: ATP-binding protein [Holophaga sp.]|nr:ATP-binding protein [Holophaga sp.]